MPRPSSLRPVLLVSLLVGCGPPPAAQLRVLNVSSRAIDVEVGQDRLAASLARREASLFQPVRPGPQEVRVQGTGGGPTLGATLLAPPPGSALTLVVADGPGAEGVRLLPLVHGFAPARAGSLRLRLLHAAALPELELTLDGAGRLATLEPGADSGATGLEAPSDRPATLRIGAAAGRWSFSVPALPASSEVLLVLSGPTSAEGLRMVAVAPSAVLGVLEPELATP